MFMKMTSCMIFDVPHLILLIQIFLKLLFTFNIYKFLNVSTLLLVDLPLTNEKCLQIESTSFLELS